MEVDLLETNDFSIDPTNWLLHRELRRNGVSAARWTVNKKPVCEEYCLWCILPSNVRTNFLPTHGFSIKPLNVKLLAGEQKATESLQAFFIELSEYCCASHVCCHDSTSSSCPMVLESFLLEGLLKHLSLLEVRFFLQGTDSQLRFWKGCLKEIGPLWCILLGC